MAWFLFAGHVPAFRFSHSKKMSELSLQSGLVCLLQVFLVTPSLWAQKNSFFTPSDTLNTSRKNAVLVSETAALSVTLLALNHAWYEDYEKAKFHWINDNNHWMQMDKAGHLWSSYHITSYSSQMLRWSGSTKRSQLLYGSLTGLGFLTAVEVLDGFSKEWGASSGDVIANVTGTALYVSQEILWNEQRIVPKFSFHQTSFPALRPSTLGNSLAEQILKDYNGQNYWLSFNVYAFTKWKFIPKWINVALGYGASGMLYATNEDAIENDRVQNPYRQFYLSLDIDLTKIHTNVPLLKTIFSVFNSIKIPAPTLQFNDNGTSRGYLLFF